MLSFRFLKEKSIFKSTWKMRKYAKSVSKLAFENSNFVIKISYRMQCKIFIANVDKL